MILGIDTSTETAGVAILRGDIPVAEVSWAAQANHSRHASSAIRDALRLAAVDPTEIQALAVAIGPGSFNGLRVGLSLAKGMAMALGVSLAGVSTLDVIAFQALRDQRRVWATVPAGRGEICIAGYRHTTDDLIRDTQYRRLSVEDAAALCEPGDIVAGPARDALAAAATLRGCTLSVEPVVRDFRRASYLAELGRRYLHAGGKSQLHDVEPLYLRRPAAEEKRAAVVQE